MSVPAKKTAPSLSDLHKKDDDKKDEAPKTTVKVAGSTFDKTPNELAAETPDEVAARYNITNEAPETSLKNRRIEVSEDDFLAQVPSGTHLHPDIAKDYRNRGISAPSTDNAQVRRGDVFVGYDFAEDAEVPDGETADDSKE